MFSVLAGSSACALCTEHAMKYIRSRKHAVRVLSLSIVLDSCRSSSPAATSGSVSGAVRMTGQSVCPGDSDAQCRALCPAHTQARRHPAAGSQLWGLPGVRRGRSPGAVPEVGRPCCTPVENVPSLLTSRGSGCWRAGGGQSCFLVSGLAGRRPFAVGVSMSVSVHSLLAAQDSVRRA